MKTYKYKAVHYHKHGHDDYFFFTEHELNANGAGAVTLNDSEQKNLIEELDIEFDDESLFGDSLEVARLPDHFMKKILKKI